MSYDWYLYSPRAAPIEKAILKAELETRGWQLAFVGADCLLRASGALEETLVVVACDSQHCEATEFAQLVAQNDFGALMEWAAQSSAVLVCEIVLSLAYNFAQDFDAEEIEDIRADSGSDYVQARLSARSHYLLRTASDERSLDFGDSVAQALAHSLGGLLEDPQEDSHEIIDV